MTFDEGWLLRWYWYCGGGKVVIETKNRLTNIILLLARFSFIFSFIFIAPLTSNVAVINCDCTTGDLGKFSLPYILHFESLLVHCWFIDELDKPSKANRPIGADIGIEHYSHKFFSWSFYYLSVN